MSVKCQNPQCDYFQKTVPDGDFCPFCGEPLGNVVPPVAPPPAAPPPPEPYPYPPNWPNSPSAYPPAAYPATPPQPAPPPAAPPPPPPEPYPYPPAAAPPRPAEPPPMYRPPAPPASPVMDEPPVGTVIEVRLPSLTLIHSSGQQFPMHGRDVLVGRKGGERPVGIDLTGIPYAERISRNHARIYWDAIARTFMVEDANSVNGVILNQQPLEPRRPYRLNHGDQLELGREHLVLLTVQIR